MIKVEVCSHCMKESCGLNKGVDLYEELKSYQGLLKNQNIELALKKCQCLGVCTGPVVSINGQVYSAVTIEKITKIVQEYLREGGKK